MAPTTQLTRRLQCYLHKWSRQTGEHLPVCKLRHYICFPSWGTFGLVFWVSRPLDSREWMASLITLSGDIETNPGPTFYCSLCSKPIVDYKSSILCQNSFKNHLVH